MISASLAPVSLINSIRRPTFIYTTSYLNDPIEFPPDPRFLPISAVIQLNAYNIISRDLASFNIVELNTTDAEWYATQMYHRFKPDPVLARKDYARIFDLTIKQLPVAPLPNT
jgi:hypothetical protein